MAVLYLRASSSTLSKGGGTNNVPSGKETFLTYYLIKSNANVVLIQTLLWQLVTPLKTDSSCKG